MPWAFATEAGLGDGFVADVQLIARIAGGGVLATAVGTGNDTPTIGDVQVPATEITGAIPVEFRVADTSGDAVGGRRDAWAVAFGHCHSDADRVLAAGYDNGDLKMFDLRAAADLLTPLLPEHRKLIEASAASPG